MRARRVTVGRGRRGGNRFGGFNKSKIYICSASIEWVSKRVRARVALSVFVDSGGVRWIA